MAMVVMSSHGWSQHFNAQYCMAMFEAEFSCREGICRRRAEINCTVKTFRRASSLIRFCKQKSQLVFFRFFSSRHHFFTGMSKRKSDTTSTDGSKPKKGKTGGHWSLGLLDAVEDPELFIKSDDLVNVIKDKYPKAKFHYLVLAKEKISSLKSVTTKHLSLLKHMEDVALEITKEEKHKGSNFKIGYHAEPSMSRLHLHVISDDMISDCLKTKKHWNSFTSEFFLKSEDVRKNFEDNGKLILPSRDVCKKYMEAPLKCHKCHVKPKNIPELKKHILTHIK